MAGKNLKDTGHSFEDYFKRAVSPMLVLQLLSKQPMYVYQLSQALAKRSDGKYTTSFLYPVLYRLQELGYVQETGKEISEDNRVRNYYGVTDEGREHLRALKEDYARLIQGVEEIMDVDKNQGGER